MRYMLGVTHRGSASSKEPLCRHSEGAGAHSKDAKERADATGLSITWRIMISSCVSLCGSVF